MKGVLQDMTNNRLRFWTEQRQLSVPQLFFQCYKQLNIYDEEAMMLLHMMNFQEQGKDFPTPSEISTVMHISTHTVTTKLQRLLQHGFLALQQGIDEQGKIFEKYTLYPLWEKVCEHYEKRELAEQEQQEKSQESDVFQMFEQELGRLLSPIEIETIGMWIDEDAHTPALIKEALKEAVIAGKLSLRYIDRILFEWKKKNIQTVQQAKVQSAQFRTTTQSRIVPQPAEKAQPTEQFEFYNWLEERD